MFEIGTRIRLIRKHRNMTLRALARAAGYSASYISQVEKNHTSPSLPSLYNIAGCLGVSMSQLFEEDDQKLLANLAPMTEMPPPKPRRRSRAQQDSHAERILDLFTNNTGLVGSAKNIALLLGQSPVDIQPDLDRLTRKQMLKAVHAGADVVYRLQGAPITKADGESKTLDA